MRTERNEDCAVAGPNVKPRPHLLEAGAPTVGQRRSTAQAGDTRPRRYSSWPPDRFDVRLDTRSEGGSAPEPSRVLQPLLAISSRKSRDGPWYFKPKMVARAHGHRDLAEHRRSRVDRGRDAARVGGLGSRVCRGRAQVLLQCRIRRVPKKSPNVQERRG